MKSKVERDGKLVLTGNVQALLEESSKHKGKQALIVHRGAQSKLYIL